MAVGVQVAFDAADPHRLARFWALALGYEKEDHSGLVEQLVAAGRLPPEAVIDDEGSAAFADVAACRDPTGKGPRLFFQRVPEPKAGKNRVHLDLHVGPDRMDEEAARLIAAGATHLWTTDDRGGRCITLQDPEGNELCVE